MQRQRQVRTRLPRRDRRVIPLDLGRRRTIRQPTENPQHPLRHRRRHLLTRRRRTRQHPPRRRRHDRRHVDGFVGWRRSRCGRERRHRRSRKWCCRRRAPPCRGAGFSCPGKVVHVLVVRSSTSTVVEHTGRTFTADRHEPIPGRSRHRAHHAASATREVAPTDSRPGRNARPHPGSCRPTTPAHRPRRNTCRPTHPPGDHAASASGATSVQRVPSNTSVSETN